MDPTDSDKGATTVVAPGRMIDNFLPIPDDSEESLPLYRMSLKLACVYYHLIQDQITRTISIMVSALTAAAAAAAEFMSRYILQRSGERMAPTLARDSDPGEGHDPELHNCNIFHPITEG
jgi:hypothetical protein